KFIQRQVVAKKRDARRDVSLDRHLAAVNQSSAHFEAALASPGSTPSVQVSRRERAAVVADYLAQLPPAYREVILLRNLAGLPFAEVARRMQRSSGARSEEHTSELQSRSDLVCRLLLEKKKK